MPNQKKEATLIARVPKVLKTKLELKSRELNVKMSEVIRLACEKFLK